VEAFNSNGNTVTANPAVSTTYTIVGSDFTCTSFNTVSVSVNPLPTISFINGSSTSICAQTSTTITATGATHYTWTPAATLNTSSGSTVIANPLVTTTYTVTGKDGDACINTATITITVKPLPSISISAGTGEVCLGKSISITASGADTYTWSPLTDLVLNPGNTIGTATPSSTQKYTVKGTDNQGCSNETSTTITVNDIVPGVVSIAPIPICNEAVTLTVTATHVASYTWTPSTGLSCTDCPNPVVTPSGETTIYTVEVSTDCGVQKSKTDVMVRQCIFIPNVITAKIGNDRFVIRNLKDYPNSSLMVFNRWGIKIFEDPAYNNSWDGETYPDGTYFYVLNLSDGTIHRGTLQIIKHN
jgi:gliding motility-associated-like protein